MSGLSTPQITYKRSLIPRAAKQYLSHIHWKVKATKCMKWILNVLQDSETFFMRASFIHLTKLPTVHSCTFNVDNETEPDDVRDELEIHTVPTIPITTRVSREFTFSGRTLRRYLYATSEKPWSKQTEKSTQQISSRRMKNHNL